MHTCAHAFLKFNQGNQGVHFKNLHLTSSLSRLFPSHRRNTICPVYSGLDYRYLSILNCSKTCSLDFGCMVKKSHVAQHHHGTKQEGSGIGHVLACNVRGCSMNLWWHKMTASTLGVGVDRNRQPSPPWSSHVPSMYQVLGSIHNTNKNEKTTQPSREAEVSILLFLCQQQKIFIEIWCMPFIDTDLRNKMKLGSNEKLIFECKNRGPS